MDETVLVATRRALHGVAELVIAGPQHRTSGTIRLRVSPGGFAGVASGLRVEGVDLVGPTGRWPLRGTYREVAAAAGVEAGAPTSYSASSGLSPEDVVEVDPAAAALLTGWLARGDTALRAFAPDVEPVLWPEHFDVAITVDEVNYGASPGDAGHLGPYAYVGPWTPRTGEFWNASFGALRAAEELPDADAVQAFFDRGRELAHGRE
jgi:hypothetical protein